MLKNRFKKNKKLYMIARSLKKRFIYLWVKVNQNKKNIKKQNIEKYKNIHKGKRCFIIATGPSLTIEDLERLNQEFTISMNSIITLFEKTNFRPNYYLIQDAVVEKRLRNMLHNCDIGVSFMGIGDIRGFKPVLNWNQGKSYYGKMEFYNLKVAYHIYKMWYNESADEIEMQFSSDCADGIYDGCTVTYSAIQLACYMGFNEIYLLGCDTNYSGHVDQKQDHNNSKSPEPAFAMIRAYEEAKKYADEHGIKIYNATRGGMLEVFPRVRLEDIVK